MKAIYFKELLELLRDRKTLIFMVALPLIIFPVLFALMGLLVANVTIDEQQKVLRYSVINAEKAPSFAKALRYHRDFTLVSIDDLNANQVNKANTAEHTTEQATLNQKQITKAIENNWVDLVIVINENHHTKMIQHETDKWQLYFNNASAINAIKTKVNKVFTPYVKSLRDVHLKQIKVSPETYQHLQTPVQLETINTADERENIGEQIGGILPYLLIVLCLTGSMYPAIDIGAGEKERGTLETLLLTPIPRFSIVMGKFLTIMTTGIITALISVSSLLLWTYLLGELANIDVIKRVMNLVGGGDLLLVLAMLIPVSAIFAALLLSVSIYARSYKEAQNYMGPMTILGFFPVMVAMLPGIQLNWTWALVPISNVALAIKEILKGTIDYHMLWMIMGSSSIVALLAIGFCIHCFNKESVLFR